MKLILSFLMGILFSFPVFSQVNFYQAPKSRQLFPRDNSDSASVFVNGIVTQAGWSSVTYELYRAGIVVESLNTPLQYLNGSAPIQKTFRLKAEKAEYKIHVTLWAGANSNCVLDVDSLVAGDVFIVNGQSNGSSPNQGPGVEQPNEWIRTFGTGSFVAVDCQNDTSWGLGQGTVTQAQFSVGVWAMKLGRLLVDSLQIPVCIINGSRYGTVISNHLPNGANRTDVSTIYGRLLYRSQKAGITQNVKALFWYQGESNTDTSYQFYESRFLQLYNYWKIDFPGLSRIFVVQTRPGCILGAPYAYHQHMRDITRRLSKQYSDITLMSSTGIPNFDGCHFLSSGYNQLGTQLYFQVKREVYGQALASSIDPPDFVNASFVDSANTLLAVKMSNPVNWPALYNGNNIKDYFYFNQAGVNVLNGWTSADTIYLQLNTSSLISKISYLPGVFYNGTSTIYQGPWLLNNRNIGALSFFEAPISNSVQINANGTTNLCPGNSLLLTANKVGFNFQWYRDGQQVVGANSSTLMVNSSGVYTLAMSDGNANIEMSNSISVTLSSIPPVEIFASDLEICQGEISSLNASSSQTWSWNTGESSQSINVNTTGWYVVVANDSFGCTSVDSVFILVNTLPVASLLHNSLSVCTGDSVMLSLDNGESGIWPDGNVGNVYYAKYTGYFYALVTNASGCSSYSDSVYVNIINTPISIQPSGPLSTCSNQKVTFTVVGAGFSSFQWNKNGLPIGGATSLTYKPSVSGTYSVSAIDSLGCTSLSQGSMLTIRSAPVANYVLSNQLDVCKDSLVTFTANSGNNLSYQWQKNGVNITGANTKVFNSQTSGSYRVVISNVWGCTKVSATTAIPILDPVATVFVMGSNVICTGDSVRLETNTGSGLSYQWLRNNSPVSGAVNSFFYAKKSGSYKVIVTNSMGCSTTSGGKSISVGNCNPAANAELNSQRIQEEVESMLDFSVFPNPFSELINIRFESEHGDVQWTLLDLAGRIMLSGDVSSDKMDLLIDGNKLPAGSYLIVLEQKNRKSAMKLQKIF